MKKITEIWRDILPIFILALLAKGKVQSNSIYNIIEKTFNNIHRSQSYSTINSMISEGLIEGIFVYKDGRGMKYYKITESGEAIVRDAKEEILVLSDALDVILKTYC